MQALNPTINLKHDPTKNLPKAEQQNNAQQGYPHPYARERIGFRVNVPELNFLLPNNRRRIVDDPMAVQVLAGHVDIHHVINLPGRYGIARQNPYPQLHIEPIQRPEIPPANQVVNNAQGNPDPVP